MTSLRYYRGGPSLAPRALDVKFQGRTGLVKPERGVSVSSRPDGLDRFGGVYEVGPLPEGLRFAQIGRDPTHYEIIPAAPITFDEYAAPLAQVPLSPV